MRFRYYAAYLDSHRGQFSHVLWTDFVDAYFQRDPFLDFHDDARRLAQTAAPAELLVFAEHDRLPISAPGFTQGWVAGCFGNEGLERMYAAAGRREIPVLCSSNVMGEVDAARDYLDAFLVQVDEAAANALGCIRPLGIDQGHHNYLIYSSMVGASARIRVAVAPYDAGPVYTAGVLAKLGVKIDRDAEGFVLRSDGHRAALVHQFNRFPELIDFVEALTAAVPD
ncbi:hypothetical protein M885DRAFT_433049 [Pelagophyceae sp. CCMP2097]|nr:hypothetical protein M885DRAFT_433049 [Pelagophyceae sp. CCMP2097]